MNRLLTSLCIALSGFALFFVFGVGLANFLDCPHPRPATPKWHTFTISPTTIGPCPVAPGAGAMCYNPEHPEQITYYADWR